MILTLKEYADRHGKDVQTVRKHLKNGRFQSAAKIAGVWTLNADEPYPTNRSQTSGGKYANWREQHPIKNPGSRPKRREGKPLRAVYGVIQQIETRNNGLYYISDEKLLLASYSLAEAVSVYNREMELASRFNAQPVQGHDPFERHVIVVGGYRLRCGKNATATDAWRDCVENGELNESNLICMLSESGTWTRKSWKFSEEEQQYL